MANSYEEKLGDGVTVLYNFADFDYIDREHVTVLVDGLSATFTWVTNYSIQLDVAPAVGAIIRILRTTPKTPLVDFTDGETLTEEDLDNVNRQGLYIAQETDDNATATIAVANDGTVDMLDRRVSNVAEPVNDSDAATKAFVEQAGSSPAAQAIASAASAAASQAAATVSETNAAASATTATTKASEASASASTATANASSAGSSATAASASAGAAATSASAAASSETAADADAVATAADVVAMTALLASATTALTEAQAALAVATASQPLGEGQTYQDMSASRAHSTTYTNDTGRAIFVILSSSTTNGVYTLVSDGVDQGGGVFLWQKVGRQAASGGGLTQTFIVPAGHLYRLDGNETINFWTELR